VSEIAQLLKIDAQTVRSTHHKALLRLREHFKEEAP
jgi:RNA polymerase sigma-70 factor (ECF subfamily)